MQFKKEFYLKDYDTWMAPVEGTRLSEGPKWQFVEVPWDPSQKFYMVEDLNTGDIRYLPLAEVCVLIKVHHTNFRTDMRKVPVRTFKRRYRVSGIPRFLFVEKTGRRKKLLREYFYQYED